MPYHAMPCRATPRGARPGAAFSTTAVNLRQIKFGEFGSGITKNTREARSTFLQDCNPVLYHLRHTFLMKYLSLTQALLYCTVYYTILYYTILYYTILYYTILYYTILYYTILYYTILYYTILYYNVLYYTILYYTILYYTILYYTILYYTIITVLSYIYNITTLSILSLSPLPSYLSP